VLVATKIAIRESDTAEQITAGIDAAERRVRAAVPVATTIYLEPDIYRPQEADRTDPSIRAVLHSRPSRPPRRDRPGNPGNPGNPGSTADPRHPEDSHPSHPPADS
jgi:hypothetical protein